MWIFDDIVKSEKGRLNLSMQFYHSKGGGIWRIKYRLGKRGDKLVNLFNIFAPDRLHPRREHKLDTVMLVIKHAAFHDRHNSTGNVGFKTFKCRLREVIGADQANVIAQMFADRIKKEFTGV
jgi:hypothetical protein